MGEVYGRLSVSVLRREKIVDKNKQVFYIMTK